MKKTILILFFFLSTNAVIAAPYYNTGGNACYKNREIAYPLEEVFDALKQTLMQSNLNIVTVTKDDGILTAKGSHYNNDEDTITAITMTIDFKERTSGITSVKAIASYDTQEKQSDIAQLGGGGISLPIPVPFTGKYALVSNGNINDSLWYQGFFNSVEKILFENYMKYSTIDDIEMKEKKTVLETDIKPQVKDTKENKKTSQEDTEEKLQTLNSKTK